MSYDICLQIFPDLTHPHESVALIMMLLVAMAIYSAYHQALTINRKTQTKETASEAAIIENVPTAPN